MIAENYIKNWDECRQHILSCYPNEGGGVITTDDKFHPLKNLAEDPRQTYELRPWTLLAYDVKCLLHSHTYDPNVRLIDDPRIPSKADLQGQIDTDVEWAIVVCEGQNVTPPFFWGDYDHRPPLMEREFIHSMQDCLGFMQDWQYKHFGLKLPMFARTPNWFLEGKNHMVDQYQKWGFVDVSNQPQARGDVVFYRIQSDVVNHIGVVIEPNTVAHHLFNRFPKTEPYAVWHKYVMMRIRHVTNPAYKGGQKWQSCI